MKLKTDNECESLVVLFDVIACPAGKSEVAHQILNIGSSDLKYIALSTKNRTDVCEYPDSKKVGILVGDYEITVKLIPEPKTKSTLLARSCMSVHCVELE